MELEDLKVSWHILNERLEKSEMLNKRIIKEMITGRTLSAYERLYRYDLFGLILVFGLCVLFPVLRFADKLMIQSLSFALLEGALVIGFVTQLFFCFILIKFNIEKMPICALSRLALTYKLWMKRNFVIGSILGIITLAAFLFVEKANLVTNWGMRLVILLLLATVFSYWQFRFYRKNIRTLEKGLEELKEFEEEPMGDVD